MASRIPQGGGGRNARRAMVALGAAAAILSAAAPGCSRHSLEPSRIVVDAADVRSAIDDKIYGHFIENLALCIYGGIWEDAPQVPVIHKGLRVDVLDMVKKVRPPVVRFPGGLYSDYYHWTDGIGAIRPVRTNDAWGWLKAYSAEVSPDDPNTFGTDEFMAFVRELGTEPYINVNFGTGTPEEAAAWVAYCNAGVTQTTPIGVDANGTDWHDASYWAQRRAANGFPEPYGVRLWGIANEIYGSWEPGHLDADPYARRYIVFRNAMAAVDPSIKTVAVGFTPEWNSTVLSIAGGAMDYLSIHAYYPGVGESLATGLKDTSDHYYSLLSSPVALEAALSSAGAAISSVTGTDRVKIALDEWNQWWNYPQLIHSDYALRDGLFAALVFNVLHRQSATVEMANLAQLVNVIGMINTSPTDVFPTPIYYAFALYRDHALEKALRTRVTSPVMDTKALGNIPAASDVPLLDAVATRNAAGTRVAIFVVNRDMEREIRADVVVDHFAPRTILEAWELNGPDVFARNDMGNKDRVAISTVLNLRTPPSLAYLFPPHSVTALVFTVE